MRLGSGLSNDFHHFKASSEDVFLRIRCVDFNLDSGFQFVDTGADLEEFKLDCFERCLCPLGFGQQVFSDLVQQDVGGGVHQQAKPIGLVIVT